MRGGGAEEGETARLFVTALRERGVELLAQGGTLSIRAPKGLLSDGDRQALRERKGELLAYLAAEGPGARGVKADPDRRHEPFPLTDIQEAYLVGRSLSLGNVGCHAYRELEGVKVDVDRLERGLGLLVERHDMLRAVFDGDGRQRVLPLSEVPPVRIARADLRSLPAAEQEAELARLREGLSHRVFDPATWPLFEVRATRHRGGTRLHVGIDLLLADAASLLLLFREWEELARDPGARLPPLPVAFRDFVVAQRAAEEAGDLRRDEAYWRERGTTLPGGPELPLAVSPAAIERPRFTRRSARLSRESWQRLQERGARRGLTPSAVVCAAFSEVLGTWSRHGERLALTLTFFSRPSESPELAQVVGDFTSTILLEVDRSGATFAARAAALRDRLAADLEHAGWSGVRVLRERQRSGGDAAAVPVVFTSALGLRSSPEGTGRVDASALDWLGTTVYEVTQTPGVWLDHHVLEERGGLVFGWDSVDALFPEGLTEAMFGAYVGLLEALAEGDAAWEGDPELVPAEQLSVREEANATAGPVPEGLLHEPFERQAAGRPEATAVVSSRRRLTYGELEGEANALGRRLRELGVGPGRLVAVVMEKGWEQVVGVLAVLKAGGAYLPVDAGLPSERISLLLRNGGVAVALVQPWVAGRVGWPEGIEVVAVTEAVEGAEGAGGGEGAGRLAAVASPEDVAYVIYTSGSTGEPKGVVIDHRGALNTCADVNGAHRIGPADRVLAISSLSFDLSVWDLFGVLGAGGAVVLPEPEAQRDPSRWVALMEAEGVTVWNSVPALVEMLTAHVGSGGLPASLRLVLMSGDWIPVRLPEAIRRAGREGIELVSMGGATEASIWSIRHPIGEVGQEWTSIPYGRAMANQSVHVLDGGMRERPEWVAGELYIGGIGLAKGYLGDEERTAAKFVVHQKTGERLYRTGDWGRWLPGGVIEFLGREDQQVKVQGHRIELGEVEAALGRLPGVRAAAVALAGERGDRRLVAFVTEVEGARLAPSPGGLAEALGEFLPSHMVPSEFIALAALPMTGNGKLDRGALARLAERKPTSCRAVVAPRNGAEETLARIWSEVLGLAEVSVEDDFFSLGGNSLAVIAVHNRIREAFPREVPIVEMFRRPTVAALARLLAPPEETTPPAASRPGARAAVVVQVARPRPPFFFIPGALGATVYLEDLARRLGADQTFYGLQVPGVDGHEAPLDRIEDLAGRFVEAVKSVHPDGPYLLGGQSSGGMVAFEMARQLRAAGASVPYVGMLDTYFIANRQAMSFQDDASVSDILVRVFCNIFGSGLTGDPAGTGAPETASLSPTGQLDALLDRLKSRGLVSPALLVRGLLEVFKASMRAIARYEPSLYDGPLHVYRSEKGIPERFSDLDVVVEAPDPGESWAPYSTHPVSVVTVPGDHISMIWEPNVALLGARMRADIDAALSGTDGPGGREGR